jgi:hypothetical protein
MAPERSRGPQFGVGGPSSIAAKDPSPPPEPAGSSRPRRFHRPPTPFRRVRGLLCRRCNAHIDGCLHTVGCRWATYLDHPPAAHLRLRYPSWSDIDLRPGRLVSPTWHLGLSVAECQWSSAPPPRPRRARRTIRDRSDRHGLCRCHVPHPRCGAGLRGGAAQGCR